VFYFSIAFSFGVLIYENIYALNILTKGTINDTLGNYRWRQILALMVRENILALAAASKGGAWEPSFHLIKGILSPKLFEILLLLPNPLFQLVYWILGMQLSVAVMSPGQQDLTEGRKTMSSTNLQELVDVSAFLFMFEIDTLSQLILDGEKISNCMPSL
jgi:hypothetical protein